MLRIPNCLDSRLIDGGKVFSPTYRLRSTTQKHYYFCVSGINFGQRISKPPGLVRPEGLGKLKNVIYLNGSSACDVSLIKTGECSEDRSKHDFATAKSWGIPFVKQKSTRSGSLFLSDGQYVGSPVDRCFKLILSVALSISRPLGVMSLDPQSVCLAL
jgi:hypothetical protein